MTPLGRYLRALGPARPNAAPPGGAPPALTVKFDPKALGWVEVLASGEGGGGRLVGHTGWAQEVAGWVLKLEGDCYRPLGEYLADDGWGELDGVLVCYIRNVRVEPGARGRGLGRAMVSAALDAVRAAGVGVVFLHVSPDEPRRMGDLLRLYRGLGFEDFDEVSGGCPVLALDFGGAPR